MYIIDTIGIFILKLKKGTVIMKKYKKNIALVMGLIMVVSSATACSQINDTSIDLDSLNTSQAIDPSIDVIGDSNDVTTTTSEVVTTPPPITTADTTTLETFVGSGDIVISESSVPVTTVATTTTTADTTTTAVTTTDGVVAVGGETSVVVPEGTVNSIQLSTNKVNLEVGESQMPIVTMYPLDAKDKSETWISSNPLVATVDSKGNITGVSDGSCIVTVKSTVNPSIYAQVRVYVGMFYDSDGVDVDDDSGDGRILDYIDRNNPNINTVNGVTYVDGIVIANKTYSLPKDYNPYGGDLSPEVQSAFSKMAKDAATEGLNLYISSGFRSYEYQVGLYERYANRDGYAAADKYSSRAGYSEHQTGLCFDLNTIDDSFAYTDEGIWVDKNCYKYGFIVRYPKGKEDITGYQYEPWHLRYLGVDLATDVYNSGMCLEEYLGITSEYAD